MQQITLANNVVREIETVLGQFLTHKHTEVAGRVKYETPHFEARYLDIGSEIKNIERTRKLFDKLKEILTDKMLGDFHATFCDALTADSSGRVCHLDVVAYVYLSMV
jgi:hypothetical protein